MKKTLQQGDNDKTGEQVQAQQGGAHTSQAAEIGIVRETTAESFAKLFETGKIDAASF